MSFLECLLSYLQLARVGTEGKTLFLGEMPTQCEEGVLLIDRLSERAINPETPRRRSGVIFSVAVRSRDHARAKQKALEVFKTLTILQPITHAGHYLQQIVPLEDPRFYRRSAAGYWEFEVEFDATYVILNPDLPV